MALKDREDCYDDLEARYESASKSAVMLNKIINDNRVRFEEEKLAIFKEHKNEVKAWKKDLGNANKKHIKLEKKFDALINNNVAVQHQQIVNLQTDIKSQAKKEAAQATCFSMESNVLCCICSAPIFDYVPDYFLGEKFNPACSKCKNEPPDPYSSFPVTGPPYSLVSHWIPPYFKELTSLSHSSSFRSHYVRLPNPGSYLVTSDDLLCELKEMLRQYRNEQQRKAQETCQQS